MRVRFIADFDWSPGERQGRVTVAYKAGMELRVTRACAAAARDAGKIDIQAEAFDGRDGRPAFVANGFRSARDG